MAFYYVSIFTIVPLGVAYVILALTFVGVVVMTRGIRRRGFVLAFIAAVFLLLPISEELWIAWNFAQGCKQAGTVIHKKVQVTGFYDATRSTSAAPPTPQAVDAFEKSGYRFIEMKGPEKFVRVEKSDGAWKAIALEHPTARYWFSVDHGERISHKVDKQEATVTDKQSNEVIARYVRYSREAPWYFVGLDRPNLGCDEPGGGPHSKHSFLIYRDVLIPAASSEGETK